MRMPYRPVNVYLHMHKETKITLQCQWMSIILLNKSAVNDACLYLFILSYFEYSHTLLLKYKRNEQIIRLYKLYYVNISMCMYINTSVLLCRVNAYVLIWNRFIWTDKYLQPKLEIRSNDTHSVKIAMSIQCLFLQLVYIIHLQIYPLK